jgi:hypothetical protein
LRALLPCLILVGCGLEQSFHAPNHTDYFYQAQNNEIDILWVVDNSCSMSEEQQTLASGFETFIAAMEDTGTDFRIGVTTTDIDQQYAGELLGTPPFLTPEDDYSEAFAERAMVGIQGSDKEKGLQAAVYATSPSLADANQDFLRESALLMVIAVTDEEDCSDHGALDGESAKECYRQPERLAPVDDFVDLLKARKASPDMIQVNGIIGNSGCEIAWPGYRYVEAAKQTAGLIGSICEDDWSHLLSSLGDNASGLRHKFVLSHAATPGSLLIYVDEERVNESPVSGWTYDIETWTVSFHNQAIPTRGAEIRAEYTRGPGTLPN